MIEESLSRSLGEGQIALRSNSVLFESELQGALDAAVLPSKFFVMKLKGIEEELNLEPKQAESLRETIERFDAERIRLSESRLAPETTFRLQEKLQKAFGSSLDKVLKPGQLKRLHEIQARVFVERVGSLHAIGFSQLADKLRVTADQRTRMIDEADRTLKQIEETGRGLYLDVFRTIADSSTDLNINEDDFLNAIDVRYVDATITQIENSLDTLGKQSNKPPKNCQFAILPEPSGNGKLAYFKASFEGNSSVVDLLSSDSLHHRLAWGTEKRKRMKLLADEFRVAHVLATIEHTNLGHVMGGKEFNKFVASICEEKAKPIIDQLNVDDLNSIRKMVEGHSFFSQEFVRCFVESRHRDDTEGRRKELSQLLDKFKQFKATSIHDIGRIVDVLDSRQKKELEKYLGEETVVTKTWLGKNMIQLRHGGQDFAEYLESISNQVSRLE